jgi:hypothetical protein
MTWRATSISVITMANPEKIAPATKYGGNMVVCHPGITEVAKSKDTMVYRQVSGRQIHISTMF